MPKITERVAASDVGFKVLGFDTDTTKANSINRGHSYLGHIPAGRIAKLVGQGLLSATANFERLAEPDALLICVPTPLTPHLEPDLSFVVSTTEQIATRLRRGQLIILESTTYCSQSQCRTARMRPQRPSIKGGNGVRPKGLSSAPN